jgi:MFS transporter, MCT family, solute carrier family 16 (monocarboxylic acid transporters), member 14
LIVAGLATIGAPFCTSFIGTHMVYAALFGFFSGGYVGLTSIIVVDLVGVDKLSIAFGVLLLFQGVAVAIGPPMAGKKRKRRHGSSKIERVVFA